jgi:hypothetical protein
MSYCPGCPGPDIDMTNMDLRFHPRVAAWMRQYVDVSCLRYARHPVYVDFRNLGPEDGSQAHPYNTAQEGVNVVSPGGAVIISAGSYAEDFVVNRPATIVASDGTVTIGH